MDTFIVEDYFTPMKNTYDLKETAESGKSLLRVTIDGENICVEDYDKKKRCGFLRESSAFGMQKCIDHFLLKKNGETWNLYMIEMKSRIDDKKWYEVKAKMRSSLLNIKALSEFLGIRIGEIYAFTTYERDCFTQPEKTSDPITLMSPLGQKATNFKRDEWDKNIIKINIDEIQTFTHQAIKMKRDEAIGLYNTLNI
ncbi:MAG: hypothetical protein AB9888_08330 [Bacteroidales bacterium]